MIRYDKVDATTTPIKSVQHVTFDLDVDPFEPSGPLYAFYSVTYTDGSWAGGCMNIPAWQVWSAAGYPWRPETAGLRWEGDLEYGHYVVA